MPLLNKTPIQTIWAERGDSIAPSTLKVARGWIVEIPPHQQMNWWMKRTDEFLAHVNQRGIPAWDNTTQYYANLSYVTGTTNGLLYRATQDSLGRNPESTTGFWEVAYMRRADAYTKTEIDNFRAADKQYADQTFLAKSQNLADVPNKAQARQNLGITSDTENNGKFLKVLENLADLANKATARTNLDVHSKAEADAKFVAISKNLSDLPNKAAARGNLGLGNSAIANIGSGPGTVAAGDDPRIVNAVQNTRRINAGVGLAGGGDFWGDRTIALGVPSTISLYTGNNVYGETHTHALSIDWNLVFPSGWRNMTGQRVNGGTYSNTSGKFMMVAVTSNSNDYQNDIKFTVNGELIYQDGADHSGQWGHTGGIVYVPPGASYSVWCSMGVNRWMETY